MFLAVEIIAKASESETEGLTCAYILWMMPKRIGLLLIVLLRTRAYLWRMWWH